MAKIIWPDDQGATFWVLWKNNLTEVKLVNLACVVETDDGSRVCLSESEVLNNPDELAGKLGKSSA